MANFESLRATRESQVDRWLFDAFFAERAPRKVNVHRSRAAPLSAPLRLGGASFAYWVLLMVSGSGLLMH